MKDTIDMAREDGKHQWPFEHDFLKRFEALIRADERALAASVQERNFCERCGKRLGSGIHTCTPPEAEKNT